MRDCEVEAVASHSTLPEPRQVELQGALNIGKSNFRAHQIGTKTVTILVFPISYWDTRSAQIATDPNCDPAIFHIWYVSSIMLIGGN